MRSLPHWNQSDAVILFYLELSILPILIDVGTTTKFTAAS
ncbi:hypothetical protein CPter291_1222 [Collimonas pratensis]|jgi:hypothetical protein|uniref:Uncharacterized protein n=1 Tax=Collimonas pratensis TaxID=279113 RepID=A0A127Q197_9BURK|nr:hypothetical protein CPter91_1222 [Collimonas pratensis]AMP13498.1 hypothetical protein CPter291_1222 [Collimonas pratensis]